MFALHFGESLQLAALGVVGQIIQLSNTVGEAIQHASTFAHLLEERVSIEVKPSSEQFRIDFRINDGTEQQRKVLQNMISFLMVFTLHELDGLLLSRPKPISVGLPNHSQVTVEYHRVFRCSNFRKSKHAFLSFSQSYWNEKVITANHELQNSLLKSIQHLQLKSSTTTSLQSKIYNYLLANAYLGIPTLDAIAANMNTSARSLQRRLQDEGNTYQVIADEVRKSLALYHMQSKNHSIKEVSYMLGYNDMSAFTKAFRRWTGASPAQFQKSN